MCRGSPGNSTFALVQASNRKRITQMTCPDWKNPLDAVHEKGECSRGLSQRWHSRLLRVLVKLLQGLSLSRVRWLPRDVLVKGRGPTTHAVFACWGVLAVRRNEGLTSRLLLGGFRVDFEWVGVAWSRFVLGVLLV